MKLFARNLASAAAFATALGILAGAQSAQAQQEIKLGYALAPNSHYGVAADKWQEEVEAKTDGRYSFRHFPSSGLGGEREVIEGLQIGTIEATIVSSGTLSNFVPETGVFDIPFLFRDLNHARDVLDGEIGQNILAKFDDVGLVALAWGEQGFRHITNNRNTIGKPEDVAGLKLRTMENPIHITAFETLGAAPTPMAWPEVISSLQQGTIDGQENPLSVITSTNLSEVQKYLTLSGHVYSPAMLLVSKQLWEGMSDEDKQAFQTGATEAAKAMRAFVDNVETSGVAQLKEEGMDVGELTAEQKAAFQQAVQPAYEQYYEQYDKALIDQIIATK
ncbi:MULTISPECIES: TRAP transporter substrate-binding protein [Nitratireductor]|uniref:TRAP transporter substrate-binding protein n=1 Tax=Nitratireductor TaxID=245876 RepID=UPI0019D3B45A|nr:MULTISPECIES: TRAP transporter substrate-binding protein [Nitratireductor]MBN7777997.1 TRAP transporter substrate-binding protein [Nitratireductor pacificus]MBN7782319.1 TRAP transporter substrate-binding protein [Nitratireductor pacificus]MBN7791126.1 TRAP transporter substrate-binding protein [Nitratireductor aquimarinus]MBY6100206.1 TRAP transporter substrate-binding protein [Nitratireductor aquimarinus]MCA1261313.1 TRAP transporter substrate-binding protein [Nitratireductor aquimarinus]